MKGVMILLHSQFHYSFPPLLYLSMDTFSFHSFPFFLITHTCLLMCSMITHMLAHVLIHAQTCLLMCLFICLLTCLLCLLIHSSCTVYKDRVASLSDCHRLRVGYVRVRVRVQIPVPATYKTSPRTSKTDEN